MHLFKSSGEITISNRESILAIVDKIANESQTKSFSYFSSLKEPFDISSASYKRQINLSHFS